MDKTSVVWVRCATAQDDALWQTLAQQLCKDGDAVSVLVTSPRSSQRSPSGERATLAFIAKHRISVMVWFGGALDPAIFKASAKAKVATVLLDGNAASVPPIGLGLLPARRRAIFANLDAVLISNVSSREALQKAGVLLRDIHITGPFEKTAEVLPHDEDVRHTIAQAMSVRPIWLATSVDASEALAVWTAYKFAARRAHRLLLIVVPAGNPSVVHDFFRTHATSIAIESDGLLPRESTQVFLTNGEDRMGLWYRLSPMTYIGGSMTSGARSDPYHAAALGSAIVHGPKLAAFEENFQKLIAGNATLQITKDNDLGEAITSLLSADKTAEMVAAGWDITSRGVEALAELTSVIQSLLDARGG